MTAVPALRPLWTLPLPVLSELQTGPRTLPMQVLATEKAGTPAPAIRTRLPRKYPEGLVLTGHESRCGASFAWLLDATASPLAAAATGSVLADLQELLREQLATTGVLEAMGDAHRFLMRGASASSIPVSAVLVREENGVLETAVMGSATARLCGLDAPSRTVACRRPHRGMLETVGVRVEVATDPRDGRPTEVEFRRAERAPRADMPILGGGHRDSGRPGYGVAASHRLQSVELRAGRLRRR